MVHLVSALLLILLPAPPSGAEASGRELGPANAIAQGVASPSAEMADASLGPAAAASPGAWAWYSVWLLAPEPAPALEPAPVGSARVAVPAFLPGGCAPGSPLNDAAPPRAGPE
jgi:hypothetical protein